MSDLSPHLPLSRFGAQQSRAVFSECGTCWYRFVRVWDPSNAVLGWVILTSSSTSNRHRNNLTVKRCVQFASAWGYGGIDIGLASTNPSKPAPPAAPLGPDTDAYLADLCRQRDLIVLAWGDNADPGHAHAVSGRLWRHCRQRGGSLAVLGWTQRGQPQHPLNVPKNATLQCFTLAGPAGASWAFHEVEDPRLGQLVGGAA